MIKSYSSSSVKRLDRFEKASNGAARIQRTVNTEMRADAEFRMVSNTCKCDMDKNSEIAIENKTQTTQLILKWALMHYIQEPKTAAVGLIYHK